jgi:hypothetical protein
MPQIDPHRYDTQNLDAARRALATWPQCAAAVRWWAVRLIERIGTQADREALARVRGRW